MTIRSLKLTDPKMDGLVIAMELERRVILTKDKACDLDLRTVWTILEEVLPRYFGRVMGLGEFRAPSHCAAFIPHSIRAYAGYPDQQFPRAREIWVLARVRLPDRSAPHRNAAIAYLR